MMNRRKFLLRSATGLVAGTSAVAAVAAPEKIFMPWEWVQKQDEVTNTDGTPLQFMPKGKPDPNPLEAEFEKYPICPYCGMNRKQYSHTRHLVQYSDDLADGTCSIHCLSLSLGLNLDRVPKAIYAGDNASEEEVKPLVNVDNASYAINPDKPGTMTRRSKFAYSDPAKAQAAAGPNGQVVGFNDALVAAYADLAMDTINIRKNRADKRSGAASGMKM